MPIPSAKNNTYLFSLEWLDKRGSMCYTNKVAEKGANKTDLGVAQLVARYLGVVEAASSSLVTQTK